MRLAHKARIIASAVIAGLAAACSSATEPNQPLLRVRNVGNMPIGALRVAFPGTSAEFGDIAVGAITGYQPTAGVYRYAPFRYTFDGIVRQQVVIDFVGEVPEPGERFTYNVELIRLPNDSLWLGLRSITRDK